MKTPLHNHSGTPSNRENALDLRRNGGWHHRRSVDHLHHGLKHQSGRNGRQ